MTSKRDILKNQTSPDGFPDLPAYSAKWHSLQIEPIQGSGEKLTVAIAIKGNDGAVNIFRIVSKKFFNCMSGDIKIAEKLFSMAQLSIESAENHLRSRVSLDDWVSPVGNISIGRSVDALGNNIQDIFFQAANLSSLLAASSLAHKNITSKEVDLRTWKKEVKKLVLANAPSEVSSFFDYTVHLPGGMINTKIDFLAYDYATDFGILRSSKETKHYLRQLHILQGKLWQLDLLRDSDKNNPINRVSDVELIIKSKNVNDDSIEDLFGELRYEANRKGIPVLEKNDKQTAQHLKNILSDRQNKKRNTATV